MSNRAKWGHWRNQRTTEPSPDRTVALILIVLGSLAVLVGLEAGLRGFWRIFGHDADLGRFGYGPTLGMVGTGVLSILLGLAIFRRPR